MVPRIMDRPPFETEDDAIGVLKREGLWEKLTDPNNHLRYIHTGLIREQELRFDEGQRAFEITSTKYDGHWPQELAFILLDRRTNEHIWLQEGTEEFNALMMLVEDC